MATCSDEEDDDITQHNQPTDENEDPIEVEMVKVTIPAVLPVPGYLVAALMGAYTADAGKLCIAAIQAIKARAEQAGKDPATSLMT